MNEITYSLSKTTDFNLGNGNKKENTTLVIHFREWLNKTSFFAMAELVADVATKVGTKLPTTVLTTEKMVLRIKLIEDLTEGSLKIGISPSFISITSQEGLQQLLDLINDSVDYVKTLEGGSND